MRRLRKWLLGMRIRCHRRRSTIDRRKRVSRPCLRRGEYSGPAHLIFAALRYKQALRGVGRSYGEVVLGSAGSTCRVHRRLARERQVCNQLDRIAVTAESEGFPAEYHSDVDGDRYVIVDSGDYDLSGWSVEVGQDESRRKNAGFGGWVPEPHTRTYRREFTRKQPWYRSHKGSPWGYLRFSRDEVDYPWSAMVDHSEYIIRWIPPDASD